MPIIQELQLYASGSSFETPNFDYVVGAANSAIPLRGYRDAPKVGTGVIYNPVSNITYIVGDNVKVSGYDFSGTTVIVRGNNVRIDNSKFDSSFGTVALTQTDGFSGLVVDHCSFDGLKTDTLNYAHFIFGRTGKITLTYNEFKNAPSDAVAIYNGVVDHNYFHDFGYGTGAHADAIWIPKTTGAVSITNNYIDMRQAIDARVLPNNAVRVIDEFGSINDVTISGNVLLGGSHPVLVNDLAGNASTVTGVKVIDNMIGGGVNGHIYGLRQPVDLVVARNTYAVAPGLADPEAVTATGIVVKGTVGKIGEVLQGGAARDWVYGHGNGDVLIGGGARDYLIGGVGVDVFTYKSAQESSRFNRDLVSNFQDGIDKFNIKAIDANLYVAGDQAFSFIGSAAFHGKAAELHTVTKGANTWIEGDINGDRVADFVIEVMGLHKFVATDFIL